MLQTDVLRRIKTEAVTIKKGAGRKFNSNDDKTVKKKYQRWAI